MTRLRDDKRRNKRQRFALEHADGSPVGAYIIGYQDGCFEAFREAGDCFAGAVGGIDHEPGSHVRANWFLRRRYTHHAWDDFTRDDDYGWDQ